MEDQGLQLVEGTQNYNIERKEVARLGGKNARSVE